MIMLLRAHFARIKIEICYRPTASGPCPSGSSPRLLGLAHVSDASPIFNLSFDSYLPDCSLSLKTLPNSVLKTAIYDQKLFKIQPSHVCGCSTNNSNGQMLYLILIQYFQYSICHCTHTDSLQSQNNLKTFDETLLASIYFQSWITVYRVIEGLGYGSIYMAWVKFILQGVHQCKTPCTVNINQRLKPEIH